MVLEGKGKGNRKRAKIDTGEGVVWGERHSSPPDISSQEFLYGESGQTRRVRAVNKGVANLAVDVSEDTRAAADWEEWTDQKPVRQRSEKEERFLHRMLHEVDKESRKEESRKEKKVAKAIKMMKVGSSQHSILSKLKGVVPGECVPGIRVQISTASWHPRW